MNEDKYLQSIKDDKVYKVMDNYLLQMSPWDHGDNRRLYEFEDSDYVVVSYQNACMIVNKQFLESDEEWEHNGKKYIARSIKDKTIEEHTAMLNMLPAHYVKDTAKVMMTSPNLDNVSIQDKQGNTFKLVKHKGKIYYMLIVNQFLPKVNLYDTFGKFCQMVNIKNVKPIFNITDKKYV